MTKKNYGLVKKFLPHFYINHFMECMQVSSNLTATYSTEQKLPTQNFSDIDCGCDSATPMSNGALIRMFLLRQILDYK